ncbi:ArnT family glycosyltransferase [Candidatus Omnitrophota bacterium]
MFKNIREHIMPVGVIACCFAVYLLLSHSSWQEPLMGDHIELMLSAKGYTEPSTMAYFLNLGERDFGLSHPPLYTHLMSGLGKFFGLNRITVRAIGIAAFLLTLILIYLLALELFEKTDKKKHIALTACILYSINPFVIRGSLLIDQDGSLLNMVLVLLIYFLALDIYKRNILKRNLLYGLLFALALWIKFVTPMLLIVSIIIYCLLRKDFSRVVQVIKFAVVGLFLFSASWYLYCVVNQRGFFDLFYRYFLIAAEIISGRDRGINFAALARNIWAPSMWYSPSLMLLAFIAIRKIFKEKNVCSSIMCVRQFAFFGALVFIFYLFIGGVSHSFPKYHCAMLPVFTILIAALMMKELVLNKILLIKLTIVTGVLIVCYMYFVGDPLHLINYALKEDIILNGGIHAKQILIQELIACAILFITVPIAYVVFKRLTSKAFILALLVTGIAFNISLGAVQCRADYNTVYCYGAQKVTEAAEYIRAHSESTDQILAPMEFVWLTNENLFSYRISRFSKYWGNKEKFLLLLNENDIEIVAYGICANTIDQYRSVFTTKEVAAFLDDNYSLSQIGPYSIWKKINPVSN